ncbi:unannotated protein [freshwater metagenome]|uniref:Unannotated protein n=1 Tax=freshwater metagenome TaxID=449393 RepID=A0A6J6G897_9ZZZZ
MCCEADLCAVEGWTCRGIVWRCFGLGGVTSSVSELTDAEVYGKFADELMRFAAALAGPSGAEDVVSAAVARALGSPRWQSVENKRAYLYRIVLNEGSRVRRDTARRLAREARAAPRDRVDENAAELDLRSALRTLTVRQRAVVFFTYWADLGPSEIAVLMDLSLRTVERDLSAAKKKLGALLS